MLETAPACICSSYLILLNQDFIICCFDFIHFLLRIITFCFGINRFCFGIITFCFGIMTFCFGVMTFCFGFMTCCFGFMTFASDSWLFYNIISYFITLYHIISSVTIFSHARVVRRCGPQHSLCIKNALICG